MKDMAAMQPGMSFYGDLPDSFNLVVNTENPLIKKIKDAATAALASEVEPIEAEIEGYNKEITSIRDAAKDGKLSAEDEQKVKDLEKKVGDTRKKEDDLVSGYASKQPDIKQLIDLALLGNGLLKGDKLSAFINRSIEMMK